MTRRAMTRRAMTRRAIGVVMMVVVVMFAVGCGQLTYRLRNAPPQKFVPNPVMVPPGNDAFVWRQIVDTVDDYFRVATEQPLVDQLDYFTGGRLETQYLVGGSIFEPWRKDSTAGFERLQSTLQSIRRRCVVTASPATDGGYAIELVVMKDLEDVDTSGTVRDGVARHDGTIERRSLLDVGDGPVTLGWIPMGRDSQLEQRMLQDLLRRLSPSH